MKTHLTWSVELHDGTCRDCGSSTLLVMPFLEWKVNDPGDDDADTVEIGDEVSGHFCPKCRKLVSLSLNTEIGRS